MHETMTQIWSIAGWVILHYSWVGVAITCIAWLGRLLLGCAHTQLRYVYAVACFVALAFSPIVVSVAVVQHVPHLTPAARPLVMREPLGEEGLVELMDGDSSADVLMGAENVAIPFPPASLPSARQPLHTYWSLWLVVEQLAHWAPACWLLGFPITCCWLSAGLMGADRLRRRSQFLSEGPIVGACARLATATGMRRAPRVSVCEQIARPILIGIVRPIILLPPAAITGWTPEQMEVVLLHELAHIRRWDNLINLFQRIGEATLFFQPGIWIVSTWIRLEREQCCDEAVVLRTQNAGFYAETLVFVARLTHPNAATSGPLAWQADAGSAMARGHLVARIRHILRKEQIMKRQMSEMRTSRRWGFFLVVLFGASLVVAGWWGPLVGREEKALFADHENPSELVATAKEPELGGAPETDGAPVEVGSLAGVLGAQPSSDGARLRVDPPKERLRYDGKTFATWNEEWETELNPTRRADAISAFEAFARNGYGEEAVRAILNVMRRYNTHVIDKSPEGKLKSGAIGALTKIDRKHWNSLITDALESENRNEVHFALHVIARNADILKVTLPKLIGLMRRQDPQITTHAISVARAIRPRPLELQKTLRQLLLSKHPEIVRSATTELIPHLSHYGAGMGGYGMGAPGGMGSGYGMEAMFGSGEVMEAEDDFPGALGGGYGGEAGLEYGGFESGSANSPATDYFPELVEALRTADRQTAVDLQAAIVRLGPKAKPATPALNKLLKQEEPAKSNALNALGALGPLATDSLPAIVPLANDQNHHVRFAAISAIGRILSATTNKTDIVSTIQLLKKPYLEHSELKMGILQIWYRSGSNAVVIRDVLKESRDDPNPKVRNAAASILARLPK